MSVAGTAGTWLAQSSALPAGDISGRPKMKKRTVFLAALTLIAAACSTSTPQSGYHYGANGVGTTPGWENTDRYPRDPSNEGYHGR